MKKRRYDCHGKIGSFGYIWSAVLDTLYHETWYWMHNQPWYIPYNKRDKDWFEFLKADRENPTLRRLSHEELQMSLMQMRRSARSE